jgi:hypothetical protein
VIRTLLAIKRFIKSEKLTILDRIGLGDPIQNMTALIDTGSMLLAVFNIGSPISQVGYTLQTIN